MRNISFFLFVLLFISCDDEDSFSPCQINEKDEDMVCIEIYQPVCGCDGVTYPNICYASTFGGVTSFIDGACNKPN